MIANTDLSVSRVGNQDFFEFSDFVDSVTASQSGDLTCGPVSYTFIDPNDSDAEYAESWLTLVNGETLDNRVLLDSLNFDDDLLESKALQVLVKLDTWTDGSADEATPLTIDFNITITECSVDEIKWVTIENYDMGVNDERMVSTVAFPTLEPACGYPIVVTGYDITGVSSEDDGTLLTADTDPVSFAETGDGYLLSVGTDDCEKEGTYNFRLKAESDGEVKYVDFDATFSIDCRCNVAEVVTAVEDFTYVIRHVEEAVTVETVFSNTLEELFCTSYKIMVEPENEYITFNSADAPSLLTTIATNVTLSAALDGTTTNVTIVATTASAETISEFQIFWQHECREYELTAPVFNTTEYAFELFERGTISFEPLMVDTEGNDCGAITY